MSNLIDRSYSLYKSEIGFLLFIFANLVFGVFLATINRVYFEDIFVREDAYIEYLTIASLCSSAALCFYRAIALFRLRGAVFSLMLLIAACIFIFGAGEEFSWGQRIFNVESSKFFATHNSQGETNVHNLVVNGVKINKLIFGTLLGVLVVSYFLVIPIAYRKVDSVRRIVNRFAIPVPTVVHIIAYIFVGILVALTPSPKKGELLEFAGCGLFFLVVMFPFNEKVFKP